MQTNRRDITYIYFAAFFWVGQTQNMTKKSHQNLIKKNNFLFNKLNYYLQLIITINSNFFVTNQIRIARLNYYNTKFEKYSYRSKNTWSLINNILKPNHNKKNLFTEIVFNAHKVTNSCQMAKCFNNYFSDIDSNIIENIQSHHAQPLPIAKAELSVSPYYIIASQSSSFL